MKNPRGFTQHHFSTHLGSGTGLPSTTFLAKKSGAGFILIELMLALGILVIVGGMVSTVFYTGQRSGRTAIVRTQALQLAQEGVDAAKAVAEEDYYTFYSLSKGSGNPYHPVVSASAWTLVTTTEDVVLDGITFTRSVVIDLVSRDGSGDIEAVYASGNDDPSTQKITSTVTVTNQTDVTLVDYYTRWRNTVPKQTGWDGGSGTAGPVTSFGTAYDTDDGNIDATTIAGSITLSQ
jgi:type II secretory pathway pseudopilin PulG